MGNLLVVDWDFFFWNPVQGGDPSFGKVGLYDWTHAETLYHIELAWIERALGFIDRNLPLPLCEGFEGFWDRFDIAPDTALLIADSNLWAGRLRPESGWAFENVWLFDAHHDAGYRTTLDRWRRKQSMTCEDWMLVHHDLGSDLHMRYPRWKVHAFTAEPAPAIELDRGFDDGSVPAVQFDSVFVCRSGGWVPPWCDQQFDTFAESFPGDQRQLDTMPLNRGFDPESAAEFARLRREQFAAITELNNRIQDSTPPRHDTPEGDRHGTDSDSD